VTWWLRARLASAGLWIFLAGWLGTFVDPSIRLYFPSLAGGQFASVPWAVLSATVAAAGWATLTAVRSRELARGTFRRWAWGGDLALLGCALAGAAVAATIGLAGARAALVPLLFQSALALAVARPGLKTGWLVAPGLTLLAAMLVGFNSLGRPASWALPVTEQPSALAVAVSLGALAVATIAFLTGVAKNPAGSTS